MHFGSQALDLSSVTYLYHLGRGRTRCFGFAVHRQLTRHGREATACLASLRPSVPSSASLHTATSFW